MPADATEVYEHTCPRMERKTDPVSARYPQDRARLAVLAARLSADPLPLPNGDPLTGERLPTIGSSFGMKSGAERVRDTMPRFSTHARPLLLSGEAVFPWMFEQEKQLKPFRGAVETLPQDTRFGVIYDEGQLARNAVPLRAAVYFDDMYVDS